jgi:hypothetical protein
MPSDKLKKVTVNLFEEDVEFFANRFGYGWSIELRRIMRREIQAYNRRDQCGHDLGITTIEDFIEP